jgi:solute:Na+ symporter, SSS family
VALLDWGIVALYVIAALGIGLAFKKRADAGKEGFFLADRSLGWLIAGTSIVATSFSADTPVFVAGMSRDIGIFQNWFWWSGIFGQMATVFFFARLWRRSEVVTDIEFLMKRYEPTPANHALRIFKVFFDGVYINCIIMASVTLAMAKIFKVVLGLSDEALAVLPLIGPVTSTGLLLCVLGSSAVLYAALSGLYGVVYTDLIQFALAMLGSIILAIIVYVDISGGAGLYAHLESAPDFREAVLRFAPDLSQFDLPTFTFLTFILVAWWSGAPGSGYAVQRLLSTKSEHDSFLAFLWYNLCHYLIRPWPWIVVGICSIYYFPQLADPETSYPEMIGRFMPVGMKGVIVASLLAAFMSTIDTHLNWGASYLVNDLYQPYINRNAQAHHYVTVSRIVMVLLTLVALIVTLRLTSILGAYEYLGLFFGGIGLVMIARWYWWRVNAWSEITAIVVSLIAGNLLAMYMPDTEDQKLFAVRLLLTMGISTPLWIAVTLITSRRPSPQTGAFYRKMRIGGPGWKRLEEETGIAPLDQKLWHAAAGWIVSSLLMVTILVGVGKLLFHEYTVALVCGVIFVISAFTLKKLMRNFKLGG